MRRFGVKIQSLDAIFISHLHGDHFFGLVGLLSSMNLLGREKDMNIYGPPELASLVRPQLEIAGNRMGFNLLFHPIEKTFEGLIFEDKVLEINAFKLKHKIPTHGFVFMEKPKLRPLMAEEFAKRGLSIAHIADLKAGRNVVDQEGKVHSYTDLTLEPKKSFSFAYCSDTMPSENTVKWTKGVDVMYHEATFLQKDNEKAKKTKHSTASEAANVAKSAEIGELFIGHLSARYMDEIKHLEEAQSVFTNTHYALEGHQVYLHK